MQFALNSLGVHQLVGGGLGAAERLIEEDRLIAEATGNPPVGYAAMMLAARQGREEEASKLIEATVQIATERGTGRLAGSAFCLAARPPGYGGDRRVGLVQRLRCPGGWITALGGQR